MPPKYCNFLDNEVLYVVYFANFQSVTDYCIIFLGNSTSASQFLFCSKRSSGIWWKLHLDVRVGVCSGNWKY